MTAVQHQNTNGADARIPLRTAATHLEMSPLGLQKLLARTNSLIRDDGRWFVSIALIAKIQEARTVLGLKSRTATS